MAVKGKRIKGYTGKKDWGGRFLGRRECGCKHVLHMLLVRCQQRQEVKKEGWEEAAQQPGRERHRS